MEWDPTKYSAVSQCNHKEYPECKNARTHYPEFPIYISNWTRWNQRSGAKYPGTLAYLRRNYACPVKIQETASFQGNVRKMLTDCWPPNQPGIDYMGRRESNHGNPPEFMRQRILQGWAKDGGVITGANHYRTLVELRRASQETNNVRNGKANEASELLCAGTFETALNVCTTCCCRNGFAGSTSTNNLIYIAKDKQVYCDGWFMQTVSWVQAITGIARSSFVLFQSVNYGCVN